MVIIIKWVFPGWGNQRVRLEAVDVPETYGRDKNSFYFHDSSKGFTHGCVEIESEFFNDLREFIANNKKEGTMVPSLEIQVKYEKPNDPNSRTYGETDKKH